MNNQLIFGGSVNQGTSLGVIRPNQLAIGFAKQPTSQACIVDVTPPTFAGITYLTLGALGQLQMQWSAATDATGPIRYEIYVQAATYINLFNTVNIAKVTTQLNDTVFSLADGSLLQPAVNYYVGVRAVDAIGNRDTNFVYLNQISPGITGAVNSIISGIFNIDDQNRLIGTFWISGNEGTISNPLRLGAGAYEIYDKTGALVPGMSQSGIIADTQGFYEIAPVPSILNLENNFYAAKVTVLLDGIPVNYNLPISNESPGHAYEPRATLSINAANQLQATIWITKNGEQLSTNLGTASFVVYDKDGNSVGISQSGLVADVNGLFKSIPVSASSLTDLTHYTVVLLITADSVLRKGAIGITLAE